MTVKCEATTLLRYVFNRQFEHHKQDKARQDDQSNCFKHVICLKQKNIKSEFASAHVERF